MLEPEEEIRSFLIETLTHSGYEVVCPVDSYVGLECALAQPFGLALINAQMPLVDGEAFLHALTELGIRMPALIFARKITKPLRTKFKDYPSCTLVHKPFQVNDLLRKIAQQFNSE